MDWVYTMTVSLYVKCIAIEQITEGLVHQHLKKYLEQRLEKIKMITSGEV